MNRDDALTLVGSVIRQVSPDASIDLVAPDQTLQEGLGMDSIDFLNLVAGLRDAAGFEIPERDYADLITIDGCVSYLVARTDGRG